MVPPEYARRWDESLEEAFSEFLRERCELTLGPGGTVSCPTLDGAARVAAGNYADPLVDLAGRVAGATEGKPLVNVLYRAKHFPVRELLRAFSRERIAEASVRAVVAQIAETFDSPVDDITVGFCLNDGTVLPFDGAAPSGESQRAAAGMLSQAFASVGAVGAPPRRNPPLITNNDELGAAATHLPELAHSPVLIVRPHDDLLAGEAALAEGPDHGVRLILERELVYVDGHLSADHLCLQEPAAGRTDKLYEVDDTLWRILAPTNPIRPAGEQAAHALAGPVSLLQELQGVMPPPWHAAVAHTSIPCGSPEKASMTRERFIAIRGLAELFIASVGAQAPRLAQPPHQSG